MLFTNVVLSCFLAQQTPPYNLVARHRLVSIPWNLIKTKVGRQLDHYVMEDRVLNSSKYDRLAGTAEHRSTHAMGMIRRIHSRGRRCPPVVLRHCRLCMYYFLRRQSDLLLLLLPPSCSAVVIRLDFCDRSRRYYMLEWVETMLTLCLDLTVIR